MTKSKKRKPFSLSAMVEQTAQMLRTATQHTKEKGKKTSLSIGNRIEQIALLLRSESKKGKKKH